MAMYAQVRHAHLTANVLGWASLTVVGTLITLLPTVLRAPDAVRRESVVVGLLVGGALQCSVAASPTGPRCSLRAGWRSRLGAARVHRVRRRGPADRADAGRYPARPSTCSRPSPGSSCGSIGLAIALFDGSAGVDRYRVVFLTAFVGGWLVQVLLGAWSYLLPMARPGHPTDRRRWLSVFEAAARVQVVLLNGGLSLLAGTGRRMGRSRARPGRARPRVRRGRDRARQGVAVRGGRLACGYRTVARRLGRVTGG